MILRKLETITEGQRQIQVTALDWQPLRELEAAVSVVVNGKTEPTKWAAGRNAEPAFVLTTDAVSAFRAAVPKLEAVARDTYLNDAGRRAKALEVIKPTLEGLAIQKQATDKAAEKLTTDAKAYLSPVSPLAAGDVAGHAADSEIRTFLRSATEATRHQLHGEMLKGEHSSLIAAILRAPSYLLTGFDAGEVSRLEGAGIAATHGETIEALDVMATAFDDARVTALRAIRGLAAIVPGAVEQNDETDRRIREAFAPSAEVAALKDWLATIPRAPKRYEPLTETKSA